MDTRAVKKAITISLPATGQTYDIFWRIIAAMAAGAVTDIVLEKQERVVIEGIFEAFWGKQKTNPINGENIIDSYPIVSNRRCYSNIRKAVTHKLFDLSNKLQKTGGLNDVVLYYRKRKLYVEYHLVTQGLSE